MKKMFAIMVALVALVAFTAPAWAADEAPAPSLAVQGRLVTDLGYHNRSKELTLNKKEDVASPFLNLGDTSYLRTAFTSADKSAGGYVELKMSSGSSNSEVVGLRLAYGWWKVGSCKLYAGQTDNWLGSSTFSPKQYLGQTRSGKSELTDWGHIYGGRIPQVGFQWESGMFGLQVALVQPAYEKAAIVADTQDPYANVPRVDLALMFNAGGLLVQPGFGWSQLKSEGVIDGGDDTCTSWIFILPAKFTMGPFTAKAEFHLAQNLAAEWSGGRLGSTKSADGLTGMPLIKIDGKIENTKQVGGQLSLEYKILPVWEVTAGFGIEQLSNDAWKQAMDERGLGYNGDNYTRTAWFIALPYEVTKNFTIHPECSHYNYGDAPGASMDLGNEWLGGIQFRFVF